MRIKCKECDGSGYIIEIEAGHACDGTDKDCSQKCPVPVQVQSPCDECQTTGEIEILHS